MQQKIVITPKKIMPWTRIRVTAETVQLVFVAVAATAGKKGGGGGVTTFKQRNSNRKFTVPRSPLFLSPPSPGVGVHRYIQTHL